MKKLMILLLMLSITGCTTHTETIVTYEEDTAPLELPVKETDSNLMSESPITPKNIDDYLFRDDCIYIDTRDASQFYEEGSIAGFINIPFYGYICDFNEDTDALFTFKKTEDALLGDPGSFIPIYEESESILTSLFSKDKNILVISTAGVESCYLLNLLEQYGYDPDKLYNVGSFTTGMGEDIAYVSNPDAMYLVEPFYMDDTTISYQWNNLTRK